MYNTYFRLSTRDACAIRSSSSYKYICVYMTRSRDAATARYENRLRKHVRGNRTSFLCERQPSSSLKIPLVPTFWLRLKSWEIRATLLRVLRVFRANSVRQAETSTGHRVRGIIWHCLAKHAKRWPILTVFGTIGCTKSEKPDAAVYESTVECDAMSCSLFFPPTAIPVQLRIWEGRFP